MLRALLVVCAFVALCAPAQAAEPKTGQPAIEVWKSATCGCCEGWVKHLEASGYKVEVENVQEVNAVKREQDKTIERVAKRYPDVAVVSQIGGVGTLTALVFVLTIED